MLFQGTKYDNFWTYCRLNKESNLFVIHSFIHSFKTACYVVFPFICS